MIEKGDLITLTDNNKYFVISLTEIENETYYLLIDENNPKNIKYGKKVVINNKLGIAIIKEQKEIEKLSMYFYKDMVKGDSNE